MGREFVIGYIKKEIAIGFNIFFNIIVSNNILNLSVGYITLCKFCLSTYNLSLVVPDVFLE